MIHAVRIITVKEKYDQSLWAQCRYNTAQAFYEHLLGKIIDELTTTADRAISSIRSLGHQSRVWRLPNSHETVGDGFGKIAIFRRKLSLQTVLD